MAYYTERHNMRNPITKTYDIDVERYALLFNRCERYLNNIAWKYPDWCPDGQWCCGVDKEKFYLDLKFDIPTLYRDTNGEPAIPPIHYNRYSGNTSQKRYDQFALLDLIEFFAKNVRDVVVGNIHGWYGHFHLTCKDTSDVLADFQDEINRDFKKTGLLYHLNNDLQVERIIENSPLTSEIENRISKVKEQGTRELLQEAILLHKNPHPKNIRDATEKIWDAFERLKTYYIEKNKKDSIKKIVDDMSEKDDVYVDLFNEEFKVLTKIGNDFRIRHHETNKTEITDIRHYDYFFNRCLSLIALAIQYLQ